MILCRALDGIATDYGCRPSDLVNGGLMDLAFDVAVRERARAANGNTATS